MPCKSINSVITSVTKISITSAVYILIHYYTTLLFTEEVSFVKLSCLDYLKNQDNKTDLFQFLSKKIVAEYTGDKELYSTYGNKLLFSSYKTKAFRPFLLAPCTHEEADTR